MMESQGVMGLMDSQASPVLLVMASKALQGMQVIQEYLALREFQEKGVLQD